MNERPNVLFLLFEGLAATVIESQVLSTVRLLRDRSIAGFEVWAFACNTELLRASRARRGRAQDLAGSPVLVFRGVRALTLIAFAVNALLFAIRLFPRRKQFSRIHARTDYAAAVAGLGGYLYGIPVIWDCRGDAVAEVDDRFRRAAGWFRPVVRMRLVELGLYTRIAARCCSRALFVTEQLRSLHRDALLGKPSDVIPCAAHEELFYYDPLLRDATRARVGYGAEDRVLVYSGSLPDYQGIGMTLELFSTTVAHDPSCRLLVLTPDVRRAHDCLAGLPKYSYRVCSCALPEMNAYLNCADVGLLLRPACRTNHVAFPTKFAEYGLAGLAVLTTPAVPSAYALAREAGNLVEVGSDGLVVPEFDRGAMAQWYRVRLGRGGYAERYRQCYA